MCGRFTRTISVEDILQAFGITEVACDLPSSDNMAPTEPIAVITDDHGTRRLLALRWGLIPSWAKDPTIGNNMINAQAETLTAKPSFKTAFKKRRCLIVADGSYEWQRRGTWPQGPMACPYRSWRFPLIPASCPVAHLAASLR